MKLDGEARMTIKHLASKGCGNREISRLMGITEGSVRYHLRRQAAGAVDGRSLQTHRADAKRRAIDAYLQSLGEEPLNLAALHAWLVAEHEYAGSLRSVQRYFAKHFPPPKLRARRRIETPPGAQGQADWSLWPRLVVAGRELTAYLFHLTLSHSRHTARVWSPRKDQLSWHHVHNEAFRRLEGIPATVRVDNEKTAMSRGAGPWGELNPSYRRYAKGLRFHIDPCEARSPEQKGKVERNVGIARLSLAVKRRSWDSWEELQAWTDDHSLADARRRTCPATGTTVEEAWHAERRYLSPLPLLPEPFDVAVTRRVLYDSTVAFESRRYSVPFALLEQWVEIRGCSRVVQVYADGEVVAEHPRGTAARIVIDPRHYEGASTDRVQAPTPLGRMGRRLQELWEMPAQERPLDLYAALAEVAR